MLSKKVTYFLKRFEVGLYFNTTTQIVLFYKFIHFSVIECTFNNGNTVTYSYTDRYLKVSKVIYV